MQLCNRCNRKHRSPTRVPTGRTQSLRNQVAPESRQCFRVRDNGREQEIVTFASGDIPFSAVLLIDASGSMRGERLAVALEGAAAFTEGMGEKDEAKVMVAAERLRSVRDDFGMQSLDVFVKGPGPGRDSAVRSLNAAGFKIANITDVTPIAHNGCRPPKKRRV